MRKVLINRIKIFNFIIKLLISVNNKWLSIIFLLNILMAISPFISISLTGRLINILTKQDYNTRNIIILFSLICAVCILDICCEIMYSYYLVKYERLLELKIENKILDKSIKLKYECFENSEFYNELKRVDSDSSNQPYALLMYNLNLVKNAIQIISVIVILFSSKIPYIWICFLIPFLLIIPNIKIATQEHKIIKSQSENYRKKYYYKELLINNVYNKEIKLYNLGEKFKKLFCFFGDKINIETFKIYKTTTAITLLSNLSIVFIVLFLQYLCLKNTIIGIISVGELIVYFQTISKVDSIISDIIKTTFGIYKITIFSEYLHNYLRIDLEENINEGNNINLIKKEFDNKLQFKNVTFKYPNSNREALKNISFTVKQGEIISIIGKNGSGKSTLINLLARLYDDMEGEILYNNTSINKIKAWRNELKILCQDFIKYEFTAKENIAINDKIIESKIDSIVKLLNIESLIEKLPYKYETQLGVKFNNGNQLSHGEWQKIALARCLYKSGEILIMDEPSSALDPHMEEVVFRSIKQLIEMKKIQFAFFITHNYDNLKYSDKTLVIDNGRCIEYKNYKKLESIDRIFDTV